MARLGWCGRLTSACTVAVMTCLVHPETVTAQTGANGGAIALSGGVDFASGYYFRGIPQEEEGVLIQPHGTVGVVLAGDRRLVATMGLWNSLQSGPTGLDGPSGQLWYQSIFSAGLDVALAGGWRVWGGYSANTSPNGLFESISEVSLRASLDEGTLGGVAVKPYLLLAFELDGQADGGRREGRYLEVGARPTVTAAGLALSAPVRLGLSLGDYYEGFGGDERFGFVSVSGVATRRLRATATRFGSWEVHGGVEFLKLGDRNRSFGDTNVIGSVGLGLTY